MAIVDIGVGSAANDGTGDSIRDAFVKTNNNFAFLDALTKNLVTNSITVSGNVILTPTGNEWIYVNDGSGIDKRVALEGTVFNGGTVGGQTFFTDVTHLFSTTTGAVQISGGVGIGGDLYASVINTPDLTATAIGFSALSGGSGQFTGAVSTGDVGTTGNIVVSANVSAANVITGNVFASGSITALNMATTAAAVFGANVTSANVVTGNVRASGNITSVNLLTGSIAVSGNLSANNASFTTNLAAGWGSIAGNLYSRHLNAGVGTFSNVTVQDIPSNYHVTNKGYVNSLVVAFAIGLGS